MKIDPLERRLTKLEAVQSQGETPFQQMLKKMSDAELDRLELILQRTEDVEQFTDSERQFWEDLCARYD